MSTYQYLPPDYPQFLQDLLANCPDAGQGVHPWLFRVARYLHRFHSAAEIQSILETRVINCGRSLEPHEIPDAIANSAACAWKSNGQAAPKTASERRAAWIEHPTTSAVPKFNPDLARRIASCVPLDVTPQWLKAHSPVSVQIGLEQYLRTIFHPGEKAALFFRVKSQGRIWPDDPGLVDYLTRGKWVDGCWFLCNPIDGKFHFNPRIGSNSQRSEESVTSFRHAVLESDLKPRDVWRPIWLRILVGLELRILSITDSGGISDHAVVQVNASSKAEWDEIKRTKLRPLVELGACDGALSAVRLTRLPHCWRNGHLQELLYLNPDADGTPIYKL